MTSKIITISGKGMDIVERLRDGMESRGLIELFGLKFSGVTLETGVHAAEPFALMTAQEVAAVQPAPWSGDGLPPVGTVCDVTPHNTIWGFSVVDTYSCTVLAYHEDFVWLDIGMPVIPVTTHIDKVDFAPIKTPAQIAAEERDAAIEEIENMIAGFSYRKCAELVYDAGYRKGYDQ